MSENRERLLVISVNRWNRHSSNRFKNKQSIISWYTKYDSVGKHVTVYHYLWIKLGLKQKLVNFRGEKKVFFIPIIQRVLIAEAYSLIKTTLNTVTDNCQNKLLLSVTDSLLKWSESFSLTVSFELVICDSYNWLCDNASSWCNLAVKTLGEAMNLEFCNISFLCCSKMRYTTALRTPAH